MVVDLRLLRAAEERPKARIAFRVAWDPEAEDPVTGEAGAWAAGVTVNLPELGALAGPGDWRHVELVFRAAFPYADVVVEHGRRQGPDPAKAAP